MNLETTIYQVPAKQISTNFLINRLRQFKSPAPQEGTEILRELGFSFCYIFCHSGNGFHWTTDTAYPRKTLANPPEEKPLLIKPLNPPEYMWALPWDSSL